MGAHRTGRAFLDYMLDRYEVNEHDRLSQMFDLTFDLSVFDMFMSWERGACVCCPSNKDVISPARFIGDGATTNTLVVSVTRRAPKLRSSPPRTRSYRRA
jgi:non-ribosomal peptide synthetase component F